MTCPVGGYEGVGNFVKPGPGVDNLKMYTSVLVGVNSSGQTVGIKAVWKVCEKCDECVAGEDALCSNAVSSGPQKLNIPRICNWTCELCHPCARRH